MKKKLRKLKIKGDDILSTSTLEQFIKMRDGISNPINKATQAVNGLYLAEEQMANSTLEAEQSMENMANGIKII